MLLKEDGGGDGNDRGDRHADAEVPHTEEQGGHQGDDDVEHQPARILAVADVGVGGSSELQILIISHFSYASFFAASAALAASAAAFLLAAASLTFCLPVLKVCVRCRRPGQM